MKKYIYFLFLWSFFVVAQEKTNEHEGQIWLGYMTSTKLNEKFALWNDTHFVPNNFVVIRHGITYNLSKNIAATGGYAWAYLSTPNSYVLERNEHRPWAQIVLNSDLNSFYKMQQRVRYDARFREKIKNGDVVDGEYGFNHRLRYMFSIKRTIDGKPFEKNSLFLSLNNEILLNFGKEIKKNNIDQFRAGLMLGKNYNNITFQVGYMYRYVPQPIENTFKHYHGLTIWVNHNFSLKK